VSEQLQDALKKLENRALSDAKRTERGAIHLDCYVNESGKVYWKVRTLVYTHRRQFDSPVDALIALAEE